MVVQKELQLNTTEIITVIPFLAGRNKKNVCLQCFIGLKRETVRQLNPSFKVTVIAQQQQRGWHVPRFVTLT